MNRLNILGIDIDILDMKSTIKKVENFLNDKNNKYLVFTANPHTLVMAQKDIIFKKALDYADLVIPDGILLVLASKIFYPRQCFIERVTGPDLFIETCKIANNRGYKYFFLGSTEEVLKRIEERITREHPNIRVVGFYSPPFRELTEEENDKIINIINETNPDALWVGMTAPKQEKWIFKNKDKLDVKFIGAIGAAFDFYAGAKKRSSKWFREHGLEWLPRLLQEPKRLWRRTFISAPLFLFLVLKEKLERT